MSEIYDQNPLMFLNGNPASVDEIAVMEGIAYELLEAMPNTVCKQYGYQTEANSILILQTQYTEDEEELPEAFISLAKDKEDNVLACLNLDRTDGSASLSIDATVDLKTLVVNVQDILTDIYLDDDAREAVGCLQDILTQLYVAPESNIAKANLGITERQIARIGSLICELVDANTPYSLNAKDYSALLNADCELNIVSHEVLGDVAPDGLPDIPKLVIELRDRREGTDYCFQHELDEEVRLETILLADLAEDQADKVNTPNENEIANNPEEDQVVANLIEELGFDTPGESDVKFLTIKLLEAAFVDAVPVTA